MGLEWGGLIPIPLSLLKPFPIPVSFKCGKYVMSAYSMQVYVCQVILCMRYTEMDPQGKWDAKYQNYNTSLIFKLTVVIIKLNVN